MTNPEMHGPFQTTPARTGLTRSRHRRVLAGVIGGLHEHYNVPLDLNLFRALIVIFSIMTVFPGILAYILLWALVPEAD
jgi:phage shock protein PspC (stress-responsive transcriptional regulator)